MRFGDRVGVVHGRMKGADKDAVMAAFQSGGLTVLVATTVIEVGVDVPNATLMLIEGADRFGLAQLHQLRGRVGRGDKTSVCLLLRGNALTETARTRLALLRDTTAGFRLAEEDLRLDGVGELVGQTQREKDSVCLLLRGKSLSETARARLALLRETNDGFRIAEEDLRLRGAGEILGTRQSGEAQFRLATPEQIDMLVPIARDDARLLVDRDGGLNSPRGEVARVCLYLFERDAAVGLLRSG